MSEYNFKTKPYAHQLEALKNSFNKEYYAFFMEMGTGKSKVLIDEIGGYFYEVRLTALLLSHQKVYIVTGKEVSYPHIYQMMCLIPLQLGKLQVK